MRALVLAGGGAKGAYQMGVWKALRKLNMKFDIVTGTSVGSLNGALIVQNSFYRGMRLWLTTDFYKIFGSELKNTKDIKKAIKLYSKNFINSTGLDTERYENFVEKNINIDKIYNSNIDFGLVTYNLSDLKPCFITKNKINKEKLSDYIVASTSCFPAFEMKEIDGDKYIDGGFYDTLPINLAVDMGATEVVAVELNNIGIRQKVENENIKITYIIPKSDLGNFLVFDKNTIKQNIELGYNDTMKVYGKLDGNIYTFKKKDLDNNYKKYGKDFSYIAKRMIGINTKRVINQLLKINFYKRLIKNDFNDKKTMDKSLELLGEIFEVPVYKIYDIKLYNHVLKMKFENYVDDQYVSIKNLKKLNFDKVINRKQIVKTIYRYMLKPVEYHKELSDLSVLFPNEFMGALYLYTII